MAEVSMDVWKRLAVYPALAWFLVSTILPCRATPFFTLVLLATSAFGAYGAVCRHRAR